MQTYRQSDDSNLRTGLFVTRTVANDRSGFTLIELLVVIIIVMILSAFAFASFSKFKENAKLSRCMGEIRGLEREITAWAVEKGGRPPGLADINRENLLDPWGNNYLYTAPTRKFVGLPINSDFDLYSKGSDGIYVASIDGPGSLDDVIRGRDGSYTGLAIKY